MIFCSSQIFSTYVSSSVTFSNNWKGNLLAGNVRYSTDQWETKKLVLMGPEYTFIGYWQQRTMYPELRYLASIYCHRTALAIILLSSSSEMSFSKKLTSKTTMMRPSHRDPLKSRDPRGLPNPPDPPRYRKSGRQI